MYKRILSSLPFLFLLACLVSACNGRPIIKASQSQEVETGLPAGVRWPGKDWQVATPEDHGLDPKVLAKLADSIPGEIPEITSLLVIRGGDIVLEKYYGWRKPDTALEIYSCTKSFTSTLIGIAVDQGAIPDLQRKVVEYFPDLEPANPSDDKESITIEDLLTMTSGFQWVEGDSAYRQLYLSKDWVQFMLDLPMIEKPGSRFNYCSGCSHLLSAIVVKATGKQGLDFARQFLFDPIGMGDVRWSLGSQGIPIGGWGLQLTSRQMARLGYLYLRNGVWDGQQIVSKKWIQASITSHVKANEKTSYGYQWWIRPSIQGYAALGSGGQMIAVVPEKDLVIVFTAQDLDHEREFQLIEDEILPSVQ